MYNFIEVEEGVILEIATRNVHEASLKLFYQSVNYYMLIPVPFPKIQDRWQEIYKIIKYNFLIEKIRS